MTTNYSEVQNNSSKLDQTAAYINEKAAQGFTFLDLTAFGGGLIEIPLNVPDTPFYAANVSSKL